MHALHSTGGLDDVPSSPARRSPLRARIGSSPNYTLKPSNSFEWRKTIFDMVTSIGIRNAKVPTPLWDTPYASLNVVFLFVLSQVIQDLAIPQASQELFDPIEA
ncbi:hypothetical protein Tco_0989979 [Tanacetum coccineum]|uniref:Uncharacterized protein n=1 Tax=Tanacetum coccineum TaxID=301880 RepID=A0ABQ5EVD2_9ASTR